MADDLHAQAAAELDRITQTEHLHIINAANITPQPVRWLWEGWLARGKLHILAGAPGTGKTTLALALGSALTNGGTWPDGSRAPTGSVLMWSGEDDATDTLAPRLVAMGADRSRVHFVGDIHGGTDGVRGFDPALDMHLLSEAAERIGDIRLIVLDPIVSAVAADSHKNGEVRRALAPVVDLAGRIGAAVIGITHFTKGTAGRDPLERVTGSLAFGALARIVLATAKREDDNGRSTRVLARAKSNIGLDHGGFEYDIDTIEAAPGLFASRIEWGKPIDGAARDILGNPEEGEAEGGALAEAKAWLVEYLTEHGTKSAKDVQTDARGYGISETTLKRARFKLGIKPAKSGFTSGWFWSLPTQDTEEDQETPKMPTQNSVTTFAKSDHLRENLTPDVIEEAAT
ncbi:MAG TPA: AAA family ATPase [Halothiobacillus sp.]|nr:AAA family ATPase [Halothiobacillus sp.]